MALHFRCSRTAMIYPADYIEQWGRKYGIGFGPDPVSEALVNDYHLPIVESQEALQSMHPLSVCKAQVDLIDLADDDPQLTRMAILAIDDPTMSARAEIMRARQREHDPKMSRIYTEEMDFRKRNAVQIPPSTSGASKSTKTQSDRR